METSVQAPAMRMKYFNKLNTYAMKSKEHPIQKPTNISNPMYFDEAISSAFKKYVVFKGRARRKEFWYFTLLVATISAIAVAIDFRFIIKESYSFPYIGSITSAICLLPSLAITVRRLHDIGKSGWNCLFVLIPQPVLLALRHIMDSDPNIDTINTTSIIAMILYIIITLYSFIISIIFLIWLCKKSQSESNKYGKNPKQNYI